MRKDTMAFQISPEPVRLHYHHCVPDNVNSNLSPVILVHGVTANHESWGKVISKIADKTQRQVYAIDLRNHGQSEWTDVLNLDVLVADLEHFIDQEGFKQPILIGHSLGGLIVSYLAMQKPSTISHVIVEDQPLIVKNPENTKRIIEAFKSMKSINLLPKTITEKEVRNLIERLITANFPGQYQSHYLSLHKGADGKFHLDFNVDAALKSLEDGTLYTIDFKICKEFLGPAIFIYGGKSLMKVAEDESIPKYFPNAQFTKLENASHMPHVEFPNEFVEIVSNFINS